MNDSPSSSVVPASLKDLLQGISTDAEALMSQTLALGRAETSTILSSLVRSVAGAIVSAFVALAGLAVLVSSLVLALVAFGLAPWAASLIVGVILLGIGALSGWYFVNSVRHLEFTLKETRGSLRETVAWLKSQIT